MPSPHRPRPTGSAGTATVPPPPEPSGTKEPDDAAGKEHPGLPEAPGPSSRGASDGAVADPDDRTAGAGSDAGEAEPSRPAGTATVDEGPADAEERPLTAPRRSAAARVARILPLGGGLILVGLGLALALFALRVRRLRG
ncbi:hypothetical protein ACIBWG_14035 [Streptomyces griseoaurantiacus]|uniref:hypothetical protein n=1 Tax=Streptomyces griseoaurantiacus TaxID=68213 RepID=UPI00345F4218